MKKLRLFLATCVLTVCLANVASAGEILTPGAPAPPPPSALQSSEVSGDTAGSVAGDSTVADAFVSGAIAVLQSLGLLAI
jgi:hypothetical protein